MFAQVTIEDGVVSAQLLIQGRDLIYLSVVLLSNDRAGSDGEACGHGLSDVSYRLLEGARDTSESVVGGGASTMQGNEEAAELANAFEEGEQSLRVFPMGIGEEGKRDVKVTNESHDLLELGVQSGFTASELQAKGVWLGFGQNLAPLGGRKRLRHAILGKDIAAARTVVVASRGKFEVVEYRVRRKGDKGDKFDGASAIALGVDFLEDKCCQYHFIIPSMHGGCSFPFPLKNQTDSRTRKQAKKW